MLFKAGDVFWADVPKNDLSDINGSRPVVILENIGEDKIKVIPVSSNTKSNVSNRMAINLLLSDRVSYVSLMIDKVTVIPKRYIKSQVGSVNDDAMKRINDIVVATSKSIPYENTTQSDDNNGIVITDMELIKPYIINSNEILKNMISRKTMINNIIIAIITGIIASLITNFIWAYFIT